MLYGISLFLSAALLFVIQPMVAKAVLPALGGTPSVWTTCLAFFQVVLLAGYAYAAVLARGLSTRRQVVVHVILLAVVGWIGVRQSSIQPRPILPGQPHGSPGSPGLWLLAELSWKDGLPLLLLAATAPLLQGWFATDRRRDPYFLYAASNAGSLAALLAYPVGIEPGLALRGQADLWRLGYVLLLGLIALCGAPWVVSPGEPIQPPAATTPIGVRSWLKWLVLAAVPSSLLMGVTQFVTQDLAAVPLLWIIPLTLYLLTYIAAFSDRCRIQPERPARLYPLVLMALGPALAVGLVRPWWLWLPLHCVAFTLAALACHGRLARSRPPADRLTGFYLAIAAGGALGGAFNALAAPLLFDRAAEYPLMLVVAALLVAPGREGSGSRNRVPRDVLFALVVFLLIAWLVRNPAVAVDTVPGGLAVALGAGLVALGCWTYRRRPLRFALTFGATIAACGLWDGRDGRTLLRHRDFYGMFRVTRDDRAGVVRLFHGSTLHGEQSLEPGRRREPRAYFDRTGPAGDLFAIAGKPADPRRVAVVGLGCGTLAAYARPEENWTFYELDPAVIRVARDVRYFTYLADSPAAQLSLVPGDARLRLGAAAEDRFDAIILDAFGSDSVPVHLLTREAFTLYRDRLRPGGFLAFNLSNRYLDLEPVVAALARSTGWCCRIRYDTKVPRAVTEQTGKQPTIWAVAARTVGDLGAIADDPRWRPARSRPDVPAWTDESSNLFRSLVLGSRANSAGPGTSPTARSNEP